MKILRNKSKFTIFCIAIIIAIFCGVVYAAQEDSISKLFGKQQAEASQNAGDEIVATVNGEKITKKGFETYKLFVNNGENKLSDREILDKIIERQLVYRKAQKEGIVVSDADLTKEVENAQKLYKKNDETYQAFLDYVSGLGMTEQQYWESVKPAYQKAITIGKYKQLLKDNFENKITDSNDAVTKFRDYYTSFVEDLKSKAAIETNLK